MQNSIVTFFVQMYKNRAELIASHSITDSDLILLWEINVTFCRENVDATTFLIRFQSFHAPGFPFLNDSFVMPDKIICPLDWAFPTVLHLSPYPFVNEVEMKWGWNAKDCDMYYIYIQWQKNVLPCIDTVRY